MGDTFGNALQFLGDLEPPQTPRPSATPTPEQKPDLSRTLCGLRADPRHPHWSSETKKSPARTGDFEVWS
jgi:hypothetical protein